MYGNLSLPVFYENATNLKNLGKRAFMNGSYEISIQIKISK